MIFIAAIPTGFQITNQKTRRRSKTFKVSRALRGWVAAKFSENLCASPLIRTFRMSPLLARSISLDSTFKLKKFPTLCQLRGIEYASEYKILGEVLGFSARKTTAVRNSIFSGNQLE
jgi:hypothetical protein